MCRYQNYFMTGESWRREEGAEQTHVLSHQCFLSTYYVLPTAGAGERGAGPGTAFPRCARAASRGRQRARSGPRRSPRRPRRPAPRRADPPSPRSDAPAPTRGRSRGVLPLPQVQAEPPEQWPVLPAAPKTLASPEAGMAGPGGRRTTSLPRGRGCGCCWRGGSAQPEDCEDGEDAPRPGREETGTQTGGDGRRGNKAASFHYNSGGSKYEGEAVKRSLVESYTQPNSNETERRENIDTVMNWFTKEDFDFVTLCNREPDNVGHRFGPEAENRKLMIQQIDRTIGYLVGATEKHSLQSTSASSSHETMR
nr:translation initiation factor IF-2-like [Pan paniscus]